MNEEEFEAELKRILSKDGSYGIENWKPPLILTHNGNEGRKEAFRRINEYIKNEAKGVYLMKRMRFVFTLDRDY